MSEELRSAEIRGKLVDALRLDLVGPFETAWQTPKKPCLNHLHAGI